MIVNTQYFREPANHFEKHGCYTFAPPGSDEWILYWDEQERLCKEGLKVGDLWITGKHYFALNFCPMKRIPTEEEKKKNPVITEIHSLPRFWRLDYEFWIIKHIMQYGATPEEVKKYNIPFLKPEGYSPGKHLVILKTRRGGYSYKEAAEAVWNYTFIRHSKSYFFSSSEQFLIKDGVINKVSSMLDWLDLHTDFGKKRVKDTSYHKKAGYKEQGSQITKGFQSEIIATVLQNSADNARGKSGIKISFEEAGSFKYLKDAWVVCEPQVKQGSVMKGYMTAFGTGGNKEDSGLESLQHMFDNPDTYNCMAFNNIWEAGFEETECGLFVPTWAIREEHMKSDGTIDKEEAIKDIKEERAKWKKSKDPGLIARRLAENPMTPSEALTRVTTRYFPVEELKEQLRRIESEKLYNLWTHGHLYRKEKKIKFKYDPECVPVDDYPIKKEDSKKSRFVSLEGCISILQQPLKDVEGNVPKNLYLIAVDPYAQDQAENSVSVGAAYVFKKANSFRPDNYDDNIVAKYIGRPMNTDIFWENVLNLAEYYNTKVQSEILGGGSIGIAYARNNKKLSKLESQIDINSPRSAKGNVSYFMKTTADMKEAGLRYASQWLKEIRGLNEQNEEIYVYNHLYDPGLLREMIKYINDPDHNFDRVSAIIVLMHLREQKRTKTVEAKRQDLLSTNKKTESFWGENLFEHINIL